MWQPSYVFLDGRIPDCYWILTKTNVFSITLQCNVIAYETEAVIRTLKSYRNRLMNTLVSPRHSNSGTNKPNKRKTTEEWLKGWLMKEVCFRYFITLSFNKQQTSSSINILRTATSRVILDFFYPNRNLKPHKTMVLCWTTSIRRIHLHILTEGMDGLTWFRTCNRKVTLGINVPQDDSRWHLIWWGYKWSTYKSSTSYVKDRK